MLRFMSNNQWRHDENLPNWAEKGEDCSAAVREQGFARVYRESNPDVIGLQEASPLMLDELMLLLSDTYTAIWGHDTPILYKRDKFDVIETAFELYPESCPGYEGCFNNSRTKAWNMAVLREKETGRCFIFVTTHLWWMQEHTPGTRDYQVGSEAARAYQIGIVINKIDAYQAKYQAPAIFVGDLNCDYHSDPIQFALSKGFVHANDAATDYAYPYNGYHSCGDPGYGPYEPKPFEEAIDHILIRMPEGTDSFKVCRFDRFIADWYLPLSDHFPAFVDIE